VLEADERLDELNELERLEELRELERLEELRELERLEELNELERELLELGPASLAVLERELLEIELERLELEIELERDELEIELERDELEIELEREDELTAEEPPPLQAAPVTAGLSAARLLFFTPWKPKVTDAPGAMLPFQGILVAA
jgi:hypothetical protein